MTPNPGEGKPLVVNSQARLSIAPGAQGETDKVLFAPWAEREKIFSSLLSHGACHLHTRVSVVSAPSKASSSVSR